MRAEMVRWPRDCKLTVTHMEAGQIGLLAPITPTPTGVPQAQGNTAVSDYWYKNNHGYLVVRHRQQDTRSLFLSRDNSLVQQQELASYRKTIVKYIDQSEEQRIEEA